MFIVFSFPMIFALQAIFILRGLLLEILKKYLKNKHKVDISKDIFALQGKRQRNNLTRCLGTFVDRSWHETLPFFESRISQQDMLLKIRRTAKGAGGKKKRQKSSKSVKTNFDKLQHFLCRAENVKNRPNVSKTFFRHFSTSTSFRPPLWGL